MKKNFIYFLLLFISFNLSAQQVYVLNRSTLQPVSNCLIFNANKTTSVTTNNSGAASLSAFGKSDSIFFKHLSFQPYKATLQELSASSYKVFLTETVINLEEVVFSANKVEENYRDIPMKIDIIRASSIQFDNPQTSADMLQQSGKVFVQQSQLGGGSPVIRGMETNRVLIVVDGVRLNNAIYRAGHLQNVITVDPNMLERVEVLHGPGSVIYGSDAMGGVMHFYTKNPILASNGKAYTSGSAFARYSSAANEKTGGLTLNAGWKKFAILLSGTFKDIGDLREGKNRDSKYGDWGKRLYYAERINGVDSMMVNNDPLIQKQSGYTQYDITTRALWKPNTGHTVSLNLQLSNSSDIPRYDRLTEMPGGKLKYAEWYYGPQTRLLTSLKSEWLHKTKMYDNAAVMVSYQNISEDRVSRGFGKSKKKHQEETVDIVAFNADMMKEIFRNSELRYGVEANVNMVGSKAYNENIKTSEITNDVATRYPDDKNRMTTLAAYASNNWEINKKVIFSQGLRLSNVSLLASYTPEMLEITQFPYSDDMTQNNTAFNGSLGLVVMPEKGWRLSANLSSGFRAPNIDDVSKLNDSNSSDQLLFVPNPGLKPEYSYNAELTIEKTFNQQVQVGLTGFYTLLDNAFVARPFLYNGQDSVVFDGTLCGVQALQNAGEAYIYGLEASIDASITHYLSFSSYLTYTYGRVKNEDVPLDHIPPVFGMTSVKLDIKKFTGEFYARYNGWKRIKDYSPGGEDNENYATADGMPSWVTLNLRASYQVNRYLNVQAGIENILDTHYRLFASGISAPGRNVSLTLRSNF